MLELELEYFKDYILKPQHEDKFKRAKFNMYDRSENIIGILDMSLCLVQIPPPGGKHFKRSSLSSREGPRMSRFGGSELSDHRKRPKSK